jgi:hypothetical protein
MVESDGNLVHHSAKRWGTIKISIYEWYDKWVRIAVIFSLEF